jgi:hypothetical protein
MMGDPTAVFVSEEAVSRHFFDLTRMIAGRLKVEDDDWLSPKELFDSIRERRPDVAKILQTYLAAHKAWTSGSKESDVAKTKQLWDEREKLRKELIEVVGKP